MGESIGRFTPRRAINDKRFAIDKSPFRPLRSSPEFEHEWERFLIDAEDQSMLGRIQVEPDYVAELLYEAGVVGELESGDRTQPGLPMKKGRCGTVTHDYKRHGTAALFAALNLLEGTVVGQIHLRHRHQEFLKFLPASTASSAKTWNCI